MIYIIKLKERFQNLSNRARELVYFTFPDLQHSIPNDSVLLTLTNSADIKVTASMRTSDLSDRKSSTIIQEKCNSEERKYGMSKRARKQTAEKGAKDSR